MFRTFLDKEVLFAIKATIESMYLAIVAAPILKMWGYKVKTLKIQESWKDNANAVLWDRFIKRLYKNVKIEFSKEVDCV